MQQNYESTISFGIMTVNYYCDNDTVMHWRRSR